MTKRALISVYYKDKIVEFAKGLRELGWELISTGGSYKILKEAGIDVFEVQVHSIVDERIVESDLCGIIFIVSIVNLDVYLVSGDYEGARKRLEADKKNLYAGTDAVLYNLDSGMLAHFAGDYDASNERLSEAEKLI